MDPQQQRVEVQAAVPRDHDFAIQHEARPRLGERPERLLELREVAVERLEVARLDVDVWPVAIDQRPEAVPLGFEDQAGRRWDIRSGLGEHRLDGWLDGEWHRLDDRGERTAILRSMTIAIQFLGAVETVTGSQYLLTVGDRHILVDCGFFQGSPSEVARNRLPFAYDPKSVDALLLTHAHLDHCGRIPALVKAGYSGPIHGTPGTLDLTEIVLRDAAKLQDEAEARWLRHHPEAAAPADATDEEAAVEQDDPGMPARLRQAAPEAQTMSRAALYHGPDVDATVALFRPIQYEETLQVVPGVTAKFHDAGHILGSAIIELTVSDGGQTTTIVFSGDLGRSDTPILRDPTPISHADYVLVESTYGNREHGPMTQAVEDLSAAVTEVAGGQGVLLIPSFAIGRTQEVVWELDRLLRDKKIPQLPLFLDSPMASKASDVYMRHPDDYDEETAALIRSGSSPLEYPGAQFTNDAPPSKAIRTNPKPFMIVASSGMLTGGRILHHLKDFLPEPASMLLVIR